MNWSEFIIKLLDRDLKLSSLEVEAATGIRQPIIDRWKKGEVEKPQRSTIRRLEQGLKIKIDDSDPNNIVYVKNDESGEGGLQYVRISDVEKLEDFKIPEYPVVAHIPAGRSEIIEYPDTDYENWYYDPREHFVLRVVEEYGYSMSPVITPGDKILCHWFLEPEPGDIVVARWDKTRGAIKRYSKGQSDNIVVLSSSNAAEEPIVIEKDKVNLYLVMDIKKNIGKRRRRSFSLNLKP